MFAPPAAGGPGGPAGAEYRISHYPVALIDRVVLADGRAVTLRPVLPQDAPLTAAFFHGLSPSSRYLRFHSGLNELTGQQLRWFTEVDTRHHLGLLAEVFDEAGAETLVADARLVRRMDEPAADLAVVVADAWQGLGLGSRMIAQLLRAARHAGLVRVDGDVLAHNTRMLDVLQRLGFVVRPQLDDARVVVASIALRPR